jgi:hypothetical protein
MNTYGGVKVYLHQSWKRVVSFIPLHFTPAKKGPPLPNKSLASNYTEVAILTSRLTILCLHYLPTNCNATIDLFIT